ncbi:hypothetical protein E2C01_102358 [Portunus trituberculatus]|uniref:Uncharacterized protein n=1 Tax=Portunus trituberculatus TaxID=210409 RepID=A0A5B7KCY9_PORTR|nr:hypothetical protein [Portunus trituberculatus]
MISLRYWGGERSRIECTVRRRTDHASLWKQTITEVSGKFSKNLPGALHLRRTKGYFRKALDSVTGEQWDEDRKLREQWGK